MKYYVVVAYEVKAVTEGEAVDAVVILDREGVQHRKVQVANADGEWRLAPQFLLAASPISRSDWAERPR